MLTYGPNGMSRGIATIVFSKPGTANDAVVQFNGMLVDKRPMKVQLPLQRTYLPLWTTCSRGPGGSRRQCFKSRSCNWC